MFWDGYHVGDSGCIPVNGCGGGEDDVVYIVLLHATQKGNGSSYVYTVVFERDLSRFSNSL